MNKSSKLRGWGVKPHSEVGLGVERWGQTLCTLYFSYYMDWRANPLVLGLLRCDKLQGILVSDFRAAWSGDIGKDLSPLIMILNFKLETASSADYFGATCGNSHLCPSDNLYYVTNFNGSSQTHQLTLVSFLLYFKNMWALFKVWSLAGALADLKEVYLAGCICNL